jgi:hypothetical protein
VVIPRLNLPSDAGADVIQQPEASVTQQPDFDTSEVMSATKDNWPTGPGGASAAFDGNKNTSVAIPKGDSVVFTFPDVTGGYDNSDTTRSTLRFTSVGKMTVSDGEFTTFANVTGSKADYTINLGSPEDFNQSVRFFADNDGSGGQVYEVQWTHELEKAITLNRIDDTTLNTTDVVLAAVGELGYDMLPIKALVAKVEAITPATDALPHSVFEDIQMRFIDEPSGDKDSWRNEATYEAAALRYVDEGISLNFVVDRLFTWSELEADLALASRSYAFYGPEGHELHFIEGADTLAAITPVATFTLPGAPNPNAVQSPGAPLMERTPLSQLVNTVRLYHTRDWMLSRSADLEERFMAFVEASNADALARFGRRINDSAPVVAWPISRASYIGEYTPAGSEGTNYSVYFQSGYAGFPQQKIERSTLYNYGLTTEATWMFRFKLVGEHSEELRLFNVGGPPFNSNGGGTKEYRWANLNAPPFDRWFEGFVTWKQSTQALKFYLQTAGTGGAIEQTPESKPNDGVVTLQDNTFWSRKWPAAGTVWHDTAIWDKALTEAEIQDVVKGGAAYPDISSNGGSYVSSANLKNWWRWGWAGPGSPLSDLYQDYAGTADHDVTSGWDESDIIESSP